MSNELICKKCKHSWQPRVSDPMECPNCKTRDWKPNKKEKEELFK